MHVRNRVTPPTYTHPLVGRGCHLLDKDGKPTWQGWVIAHLGDGYFLIQLMEWLTGAATQQIILSVSDMSLKPTATGTYTTKSGYVFYDSIDAMKAYYNATWAKK